MSSLEMILKFMGEHPFLTVCIIGLVSNWTPIKIINQSGGKADENNN